MLFIVLALTFIAAVWTLALAFGLALWIPAACSVAVLLLLAGRIAWKEYRGAKASREIERSLASQAQQFERRARPDQLAEARALAAQFDKALHTLKSSKLAKGRGGPLYALPWYVIIGPPGAGKSTAIRQSGLKFPLLGGKGSVRGIGGTRNCDWWLTNEAVLLDTAGRYATEEDDHDEWLSFLDMLRRARPKRPLNGLIVAIGIAEVGFASERELETLSQRIRDRVDEVMARLEVRLPVYVMLTKCDLLPGFIDSFEDLRKSERNQVLGFTLPLSDRQELAECIEEQWTRLTQVIERRCISRMADARGVLARRNVFAFPQQLEALKSNIATFMSLTFMDNVYREAPIVRGLYLTSGTQEGSPVDRLMDSMAAAFGLPPGVREETPRTDTKSYFLGDLFREVMFPDQELAAKSALAERRRRTLTLVGVLGLIGVAATFSILAVRSYIANRDAVHGAQRELAAAMSHRGGSEGIPISLASLEPIRTRLATLRQWSVEGAPWSRRLGLYQGELLLPQLRTYYTSTLRSVLMEPLVERIEREMSQMLQLKGGTQQVPTAQDHAWLYERTRAYLLLTQPKEQGEPPLTSELKRWLGELLVETWIGQSGHDAKASPAERQAMTEHVDAYLELLATDPSLGFTRSASLVGDARELLSRVPMVKLAIDRIVAELQPLGLDLTLEHLVGAAGLPISASWRVRGAFTRRAWEEHVRPILQELPDEFMGDAWVLESLVRDDRTQEARVCALRSEYFGRYADEWRAFIGTLRVEEPVDHARALVVLQDLTRGQPPPLERVMRAVAYNARLGEPKPTPSELEKKAEEVGVLDQIRKRVQDSPAAKLLHKKDPCSTEDYLTEQSVRRALEGFFSFGATWDEPREGAPSQLTGVQIYHEQLTYIRDALQAYLDDPTSADPLLSRLASARTRVRSLIETQEVGWRPRFDALLWPPVNGSSASSTSALAGEKALQWCTSVVLPFQRSLADRYPFAKQGQDAALADLSDFYRPGSGILWGFYDAALKRDVAQVGNRFELREGGVGSMYGDVLVRFLNRSHYLSTVLFPPRAEKPRVEMELRVRPSPGIAQVLLDIDGQLVDFHNGPERWHRITWPGEGEKRGASMRVKGAHIDETLVQEGEWGLFRMLDKGTIAANPGERFFTARWRLHTQNDVTIDIRPARLENPFVGTKAYLEPFRAEGVEAPRVIAQNGKACSE